MGLVFIPEFPSIPGRAEIVDENGVHRLAQFGKYNFETSDNNDHNIIVASYRQGVNEAE